MKTECFGLNSQLSSTASPTGEPSPPTSSHLILPLSVRNWPAFISFKRYLAILGLFSTTNSQTHFISILPTTSFLPYSNRSKCTAQRPTQKWQMNIPTEDDFITIFDRQQRSQDLGQAIYQLLADIKAEHPERFPPAATETPTPATPTTDDPN